MAGTVWPLFKLEALAVAVVVFLLTLLIVSTLQVAVLGGAAAGTVVWVAGLVRRPPTAGASPRRNQADASGGRIPPVTDGSEPNNTTPSGSYDLLGAGVDPAFEFAATEREHAVTAVEPRHRFVAVETPAPQPQRLPVEGQRRRRVGILRGNA